MSQHKTLTNFDKGKILREARKQLGLTQKDMALRLGLDSTYLSQLENGHREVDDHYLKKANEVKAEFEKSKSVQHHLAEDAGIEPATRQSCVDYLQRFLETCDDNSKLGWTLIELHEHFPLDKWRKKRGKEQSSSDPKAYLRAAIEEET